MTVENYEVLSCASLCIATVGCHGFAFTTIDNDITVDFNSNYHFGICSLKSSAQFTDCDTNNDATFTNFYEQISNTKKKKIE